MEHFRVNGVETPAPLEQGENFESLIGYIHRHYVTDGSLISGLRVNGVEISERDEAELAKVHLSELESVEVTLSHPRELAEETLQTLIPFTHHLSDLSRKMAETGRHQPGAQEFRRLVDGVETFCDTLRTVKGILRVAIHAEVNILEVDLVDILKDLLETHASGDVAYRHDLLAKHLPDNLRDWRESGIPALIRSRDS
jgi:hypothetical protein